VKIFVQLFLVSFFVVGSVLTARAGFIKIEQSSNKLLLDLRDPVIPRLTTFFNAKNIGIEGGEIHFYCKGNISSGYFMTAIFRTKIAEFYASSSDFIVGFSDFHIEQKSAVVATSPSATKDEGIKQFGFNYYETLYVETARYFTPTHIDEYDSLYGKAFLKPGLLERLSKPVFVSFVFFQKDENRWNSITRELVEIDPLDAGRFFTACSERTKN
jgi:hypothetical protein